jgi:hypothetical protein
MAFAIDAAATIPDHFQGTKVQDSLGKKSFLQSPTAGQEWKRSLVVPWLVVCEDFGGIFQLETQIHLLIEDAHRLPSLGSLQVGPRFMRLVLP